MSLLKPRKLVRRAAPRTGDAPRAVPLAYLKRVARPMRPGALEELASGGLGKVLASLSPDTLDRSEGRTLAFVAPALPHGCELELWNAAARDLNMPSRLFTAESERSAWESFRAAMDAIGTPVSLEPRFLASLPENRSFLPGLEAELGDAALIVALGETSLATFQATKVRRGRQSRLAVWQNAPRFTHASTAQKAAGGVPLPEYAREKTLRQEILKNCDLLLSQDKESASWAFLEGVHPARLRRIQRGINELRFNESASRERRVALRAELGIPENAQVLFHCGSLEAETGVLDSVLAFRTLLNNRPEIAGRTKLALPGSGGLGAEVRQLVIDLGLDDDVYFLTAQAGQRQAPGGNQMDALLPIADVVLHSPGAPVNGAPQRGLDPTYDVLCAAAQAIPVLTNGNGWVGEWLGRTCKTVAGNNIHALSRAMAEALERLDKGAAGGRTLAAAVRNEMGFDAAQRELTAALRALRQPARSMPNADVDAALLEIGKLIEAKLYLDAIQSISRCFEREGLTAIQRATLFRCIGDCFTRLGDLGNGHDNYARAVELDPYCARSIVGLGTIALQRQNYAAAVPMFQKAVGLAPRDSIANLGLGLAFEGLGEPKQAIQWTSRACELNIENTAAIFNLVKLSYEHEQFDEADAILRKYHSLRPHDVNMAFSLGGIAFKLGDHERAAALMQEILALEPMNSRAHALLGQIGRQEERRRQAG